MFRTLEVVLDAINKKQSADGLPAMEKFVLHDLRRSYLTHLANVEERIHVVNNIAGHSNSQTTLKHYVHAQELEKRQAANKLKF